MENPQALRKWLALRGITIMTLSDGKKIGSCEDFLRFSPHGYSIMASMWWLFLTRWLIPCAN
jgi:hypothetical protein